mgnify:CR=1 FL=1
MKKYAHSKTFTFEGRRYKVYGDTLEEVYTKMVIKKQELEKGQLTVHGDMTLKAWSDICVDTYKTNQKDITRSKYKSRMNHCIIEEIGEMKLKKIRPIHCQEVLNLQAGKSKRQIDEVYMTLRFLFRKALANGLITSDPTASLERPSGTKTTRRSITAVEEAAFLSACELDNRRTVFLIMYYCGCRPSEAIGCQGRDITKIDGYNMLHIRGTKTAKSDRLVPIDDKLYQKVKNVCGFDCLAVNQAGNKFNRKSWERAWAGLKHDMNIAMGCRVEDGELVGPYPLAKDFVPYCLRHTFCTNLQKQGVDIRTAQYLMGHSDIKMTANIYTHADTSTITEAAKLMHVIPDEIPKPETVENTKVV